MKNLKSLTSVLPAALAALAVALTLAAACTSSPSEPKQTPTTPVPPVPLTTFSVSVSVSQPTLTVGSTNTSTITITVRRTDTGAAPPELTLVHVTTTLGEFNSQGSTTKATDVQLVGGQAQVVLFPGGSVGKATVTATLPASLGSASGGANVDIAQPETFFISSVSPGIGSPQGGDVVTINGGGFVAPVRVTFGTAAAVVRSTSPNQIVAVVPAAAAAGVQVAVGQSVPVAVGVTIHVNEAGTKTDALPAGFAYVLGGGGTDQPQVFSVTPASGTNDGGTTVTINGDGFVAPVQVFFEGGSPRVGLEASVQSVTKTRIIVTTPAARGFGQPLANGTADIRVKNTSTGFEGQSVGAFRYGSKVIITSFGPGQLAFDDTTTLITIHGQGFESPASASIANVAARVLSISGTEIVVQSPGVRVTSCRDVSGPVGEVNINTGDGDSTASGDGPTGNFIYVVPPVTINSVRLTAGGSAGRQSGGEQVTILGSQIDGNTRIQFGDQVATVVGTVPGGVVVLSPPFLGTYPTQSCTDISGTLTGTQAINAAVDIKATNVVSTCTDTSAKAFLYAPPNPACIFPPPTPTPTPTPTPRPVASFTFTVNALTAIFNDTSTNTPTSWNWNFGDGSPTSAAQNPVHTFVPAPPLAPGQHKTYVVTLTVSNAGGTSTSSQFVTVPNP